jgi:hypothetical protein
MEYRRHRIPVSDDPFHLDDSLFAELPAGDILGEGGLTEASPPHGDGMPGATGSVDGPLAAADGKAGKKKKKEKPKKEKKAKEPKPKKEKPKKEQKAPTARSRGALLLSLSVYEITLGLAALALGVGCLNLLLELWSYNFMIRPVVH